MRVKSGKYKTEAECRAYLDGIRESGVEALSEALKLIASCKSRIEGDVVDIAQKALAKSK